MSTTTTIEQPPEQRVYTTVLEVRDVDVTGLGVGAYQHIAGRAVPYNTWANAYYCMEQWSPGALASRRRNQRARRRCWPWARQPALAGRG